MNDSMLARMPLGDHLDELFGNTLRDRLTPDAFELRNARRLVLRGCRSSGHQDDSSAPRARP